MLVNLLGIFNIQPLNHNQKKKTNQHIFTNKIEIKLFQKVHKDKTILKILNYMRKSLDRSGSMASNLGILKDKFHIG
jgi:hypothetical protein